MLSKIYRLFYNLILKQDYVSFKISSDCTGVIKSCVLLDATQVARINSFVQKCGYRSESQQNNLLVHISVYLLEGNILSGTRNYVSSKYVPNMKKGTGKLLITISPDE